MVKRIKEICKEKKMTMTALEKESGVGTNTIYKWDSVKPSYDKVVNVAKVLGCTVEELIGE